MKSSINKKTYILLAAIKNLKYKCFSFSTTDNTYKYEPINAVY